MAADSCAFNEPLQLEPFIHQVGGHSSMLQLDEDTICKPLITQEANFYKTAPESLKQFMAEYRGIIEVTFSEANDGYLDLTAYLPHSFTAHSRTESRHNSLAENEHKTKHRIRICQSGSIQIDSVALGDQQKSFGLHSLESQNGSLNPWVLHCHYKQLQKLSKSSSVVTQKYIVLENRVSKYKCPCILDIKMGTRPYGDGASLAKRQSQSAKAAASTTASLGLRLTGMAVYDQKSGRYICQNKYYGYSLSAEGFHQVLYNFLHDGQKIRYKVVTVLLEKLHQLYSVVQALNTFRFFTSSLLIIFEGKEPNNKNSADEKNITLQLSDNQNLSTQDSSNSFHQTLNCDKCPSVCRTHAADSYVGVCKTHAADSTSVCRNHAVESCPVVCRAHTAHSCTGVCKTHTEHSYTGGCRTQAAESCTSDSDNSSPVVDVCVIDFAHATHSQMPDAIVAHTGPDDGYLFGLKNLIAQLELILKSE